MHIKSLLLKWLLGTVTTAFSDKQQHAAAAALCCGLHEQNSVTSHADRHASLAVVLYHVLCTQVMSLGSNPRPALVLLIQWTAVLLLLKSCCGPGSAGGQQQAGLQPDPEIVNQLVGMGFSENGSKRAAVATQVSDAQRHDFSDHLGILRALLGQYIPKGGIQATVHEHSCANRCNAVILFAQMASNRVHSCVLCSSCLCGVHWFRHLCLHSSMLASVWCIATLCSILTKPGHSDKS